MKIVVTGERRPIETMINIRRRAKTTENER